VKGEYSYQPTLMLPIASKWRMWKKYWETKLRVDGGGTNLINTKYYLIISYYKKICKNCQQHPALEHWTLARDLDLSFWSSIKIQYCYPKYLGTWVCIVKYTYISLVIVIEKDKPELAKDYLYFH
jgi:hypothetical protein